MKPYQQIVIVECGEPLTAIPLEQFAVVSPHPYEKLGATYGDRSPYYLRQGVLESLIAAQHQLAVTNPDWRIDLFDAFRPVEVQQFMVDYTFAEVVQAQGLNLIELTEAQRQAIWEIVYQFWAPPNLDPAMPPPHSTGAAVDITLVDNTGKTIDMGGEIDEISARSHPDYYANSIQPVEQQYHSHRQLLNDVMLQAGFRRHPNEWWHFCLGDQMWAWLCNQENPHHPVTARYGRVA
ncbi:D-alanyl-D-alanine dipeptidase [Coleofasciculus sp. FACHB-64]|uniref:M15 family metallopeptidase n=1 Tax=Cyanophyceae TaxID=3028117 RepID=UPI00168546D0|nr:MULTISPECIES: M15 family metallopeptidase [unclassified Coleofasciculus]MBD1838031.1 D-alanyl-D-alanine dipeptidase [Coleofasciculus sp. FACHB-501]MBD1891102.1 D-alanyl-D-alanine dipeptidase [Coleofasciculus sp. FACHB-SPT9]MBD2046275.1 D-alanyl-D-alanine dipeptidase [Coleofasciculus sp. FACHB-64]